MTGWCKRDPAVRADVKGRLVRKLEWRLRHAHEDAPVCADTSRVDRLRRALDAARRL